MAAEITNVVALVIDVINALAGTPVAPESVIPTHRSVVDATVMFVLALEKVIVFVTLVLDANVDVLVVRFGSLAAASDLPLKK